MTIRILIIFLAIVTLGCNDSQHPQQETPTIPEAIYPTAATGEVVAVDSVKIAEDELNNFYFVVEVAATDRVDKGIYSVLATWGHYMAEGSLTMPRGGEHLVPVLRKADEPYTYHIGFYYKDDTTFHDYYLVKGRRGSIEMKYLRSYAIQ